MNTALEHLRKLRANAIAISTAPRNSAAAEALAYAFAAANRGGSVRLLTAAACTFAAQCDLTHGYTDESDPFAVDGKYILRVHLQRLDRLTPDMVTQLGGPPLAAARVIRLGPPDEP